MHGYVAAISSSLPGCVKHITPGNMLSLSLFSVESMGPHGQRTAAIYLKERATPGNPNVP